MILVCYIAKSWHQKLVSVLFQASIRYTSAFSDEEAPEPSPTLVELPTDTGEKSKDPEPSPTLVELPTDTIEKSKDLDVDAVIPATSDLNTTPTGASETVDHDDNLKLTRDVNLLEPKALYYRKKREKADAAYFYQCEYCFSICFSVARRL